MTAQPYTYIFFLGVHPELSRVEIEYALRARGLSPTLRAKTDDYVLIEVPSVLGPQLQDVLGGSDRFGRLLATCPQRPTASDLSALLSPTEVAAKKISVGLSGCGVDRRYLTRLGNELKSQWQDNSGKLRFILPTGRSDRLNAASVMAHRLDEAPHAELTIVRLYDGSYGVCRTVAVQDIRSYELRDTQRPARDARVGLLPPKLAQIMLNIAAGAIPQERNLKILDPFCGMGTILQEGWLMDYKMTGSDSSERMIRATEKNLNWLCTHFKVAPELQPRIFMHQADTRWSQRWQGALAAVVTEPFLGQPVKAPLTEKELVRRMDTLGELYRRFFKVTHPVLRASGVIVFALPAWRVDWRVDDWHLFPKAFLDALARVGYSRHQLGDDERGTLLYARPRALVGRELTLWSKFEHLVS